MNTKKKQKTIKYRRQFNVILSALFLGTLVSSACLIDQVRANEYPPVVFYKVETQETQVKEVAVIKPEPEPEIELPATNKEIDLLALVTMAEAEGESELGKRLVIDTILNRVDHSRFPNSISGVIYQKNQFEAMWNGRVDRCYIRDDIRQLVIEELQTRTNSEVIFFRTGHYSSYGTPIFKEGNHYFSKN